MAIRIEQSKYKEQNEDKANVKERNSLLKILQILTVLFQFLGLIPIARKSKTLKRLQQIWCLLLLIMMWMSCVNVIQILPETFTSIEKGFYLCEMIFNSIIPLNIYYITFVRKTRFLKIYKNCMSILEQLKMTRGLELRPYTPVYRLLRNEVLLLIFLVTAFYIFSISIIATRNNGNPYVIWEFYWAFIMPNILITNNLCVYWLSLRFISLSYTYMNNILKEFKGGCSLVHNTKCLYLSTALWYRREFYSFNFKKTFKVYDIFITLVGISYRLDQLMVKIIDIFYVVLLLDFINSFTVLAVQVFGVYKYFDDPDIRGLLLFLLKFARLLMHIFNLLLILWPNNMIVEEKCRTICILNNMPLETWDMENNVNDFLLQINVRKTTSALCNIFDLDLQFLLSIASALASYVIFLIQIDLGAVSIEERFVTLMN